MTEYIAYVLGFSIGAILSGVFCFIIGWTFAKSKYVGIHKDE